MKAAGDTVRQCVFELWLNSRRACWLGGSPRCAAMAYSHTTAKELELMTQWHVDKGMQPAAIATLLGRHRGTIARRLAQAPGLSLIHI